MDEKSQPGGKQDREVVDPLKGWGPTVFIVAGTLLMLFGVSFWFWVMQNTGVQSPLRVAPTWIISSGILLALVGAPAWWLFWWYRAQRPARTN